MDISSVFVKQNSDKPVFALMDGEKLIKEIKPHYLAFYDMFLVWAWVILLSLFFISFGEEVSQFLGNPMLYVTQAFTDSTSIEDGMLLTNIPTYTGMMQWMNDFIMPVNDFMKSYTPVGLWISVLVFSSFAISVLKISWKWIAIMLGVGLMSLLLTVFLKLPAESAYYFGMIFSVFGIAGVELYRRSHTFYLTDRRIVTEVQFIDHKRNELNYDKINNLVLEQDILGRVFDFGTLIPVTASGLGMGTDFSAVTVGVAGQLNQGPMLGGAVTGGRSVQTPRVRSPYGVFGISEPEKVQQMLSKYMHEHVEAPYLKKMTDQLQNLTEKIEQNGGSKERFIDQVKKEPIEEPDSPAETQDTGDTTDDW